VALFVRLVRQLSGWFPQPSRQCWPRHKLKVFEVEHSHWWYRYKCAIPFEARVNSKQLIVFDVEQIGLYPVARSFTPLLSSHLRRV
jgi:hypothetical protein